jgi:hypothetical protein
MIQCLFLAAATEINKYTNDDYKTIASIRQKNNFASHTGIDQTYVASE